MPVRAMHRLGKVRLREFAIEPEPSDVETQLPVEMILSILWYGFHGIGANHKMISLNTK